MDEASGAGVARDAALTAAVEARATMTRFSGGLTGGAGTDGDSFEYLDHTADVQLHSWGGSMERAMEAALAAMFNVMTDIKRVDVDPSLTREVEAQGHDGLSLLFALLDEFLFLFHSEGFAVKKATVVGQVDREAWKVRVKANHSPPAAGRVPLPHPCSRARAREVALPRKAGDKGLRSDRSGRSSLDVGE
ncbi:unnamed protein product [Ascophyllum nodosum]